MLGLRLTVDDQQALREQLRVDPSVHRRRRTTLISASIMIVTAFMPIWFALSRRVQVGPGQFNSPLYVIVIRFCALLMFGIGALLLARSPFRLSPGERLFRLVWLGPIGTLMVRLGARGARSRPDGEVRVTAGVRATASASMRLGAATASPAPVTVPTPSLPLLPTLASLDARVPALERAGSGKH